MCTNHQIYGETIAELLFDYKQYEDYEYLLILNGDYFLSENAYEEISKYQELENPIIFLNPKIKEAKIDKVGVIDFYRNHGIDIAESGAVLISTKVLHDYIKDNEEFVFKIKEENDWYYYQMIFYLTVALQLDNILCISGMIEKREAEALLTSVDIIHKWKEAWIHANNQLPDCFDTVKEQVIKKAETEVDIFHSVPSLIGYTLANKQEKELRNNWELVSDIPVSVILDIQQDCFDLEKCYKACVDKYLSNKSEYGVEKVIQLMQDGQIIDYLRPHSDLAMIIMITNIYKEEIAKNTKYRIFDQVSSSEDIIFVFQQLKFYLWEAEFYDEEETKELLKQFIIMYHISGIMLRYAVEIISYDKYRMLQYIKGLF